MRKFLTLISVISLIVSKSYSQENYSYTVDLLNVDDDKVMVILETPEVQKKNIHFYMPKIIPGTYNISDFGKFVSNVQAYDKKGRNLPVQKVDENKWKIDKANKLEKITYWVDDTYDTDIPNKIYPMAGTNIEDNKNFVIAGPGFFGYLEGMKNLEFNIKFEKPTGFYGSTGLIPLRQNASSVIYQADDYDHLVDSPIMFNQPDTTTIEVGNAKVLISVYSPNKKVTSAYLAQELDKLLLSIKNYLGGDLPVEKYAFIYYFDAQPSQSIQGALEHSYSSFYYLAEMPQEQMISQLVDIAAHEFFHIVTPLTIHSEEIENFDFNNPDLSKHLWLYEGVTEYSADHVQVFYNMISIPEYIDKLEQKILVSRSYFNDTLPFTELSEKAAGEYSSQYTNVYEKGALIAAMLDIRLNDLSNGEYNLQKLLRDLQNRFGKDAAFKDDELFGIITEMTYPEIGTFFKEHVAGNNPLPLEDYFKKVGMTYTPEKVQKQFSLGNVQIGYDAPTQKLMVANTSRLNEFGQAVGYKRGDVILKIEGREFTTMNGQQLLNSLQENIREGDTLNILIERDGNQIELTQEVFFVEVPLQHQLELMENTSFEQQKLRNQWLQANPVTARMEDVSSIDGILAALYGVISGPAGDRDWDRFKSLFTPDAIMGAIRNQSGSKVYVPMTPQSYVDRNSDVFKSSGFYEEEIGRTTNQYANIAQIFSAYQFRLEENGAVQQRGVNSIQLVKYNNRWWIASIIWNAEFDEIIPEELINK